MIDSVTIIVAQDQTDAGIIHSGGIPFRYMREGKGCPMFVIGSSGYSRFFSGTLRDHFNSAYSVGTVTSKFPKTENQ